MSSVTALTQPPSEPPRPYGVVAACDFSQLGDRAVREALGICSTQPSAALHVVTVVSGSEGAVVLLPGPELRFRSQQVTEEMAREHLKHIADELTAQNPALPLEKIAVYVMVGAPRARTQVMKNMHDRQCKLARAASALVTQQPRATAARSSSYGYC